MENYDSRIPFGNGKFAYVQKEEFRTQALEHMNRIRGLWSPPSFYFHLQPGGHLAALRSHIGNRYFGRVDLERFFENVTKNRLIRTLKRIGYSFADSREFASASTVRVRGAGPRRFALPYGFVQSPLLASVALDRSALGSCLSRLDRSRSRVSVYVDDIVVSSIKREGVISAMDLIRRAADQSGFPVNKEKVIEFTQEITVFNIIFDGIKMEIKEERFEEMSQDIAQEGPGASSMGFGAM